MIDSLHNGDKVIKEALQLFLGKSLDFFGINYTPTEILDTEIIETKKSFGDKAFATAEKMGLHFESESHISKDDIIRFCSYNIDLTKKHKIPFTTIIITPKGSKQKGYNEGSINFSPIIIDLSTKNADEILKKAEKGEHINELELIYLPLYTSKDKNKEELLEKAINIVYNSKELDKNKIFALQILLTSTLIEKEKLIKILEDNMFKLENNPAIDYFERKGEERGLRKGEEEGKIKGKEEEKFEVAMKMLQKGFSIDDIADITNMPKEWVESSIR